MPLPDGADLAVSRVGDLLKHLDEQEVRYCLLREHGEDPSSGLLEIDLLVAPDHLARLGRQATAAGFLELPSWGHVPHVFFLKYDEPSGRWLKLDVVTELRYGQPVPAVHAVTAAQCLSRCRRIDGIVRLAPEDEFLHLILHAVLDKGHFDLRHRARLAVLRRQIAWDALATRRLIDHCKRYLAPVIGWMAFERDFTIDDWSWATAHRHRLFAHLRREDPIGTRWLQVSGLVRRRLHPMAAALTGRGCTIALLGPDGAGKTTLADHLARAVPLRTRRIYMGYGSRARREGPLVTRCLAALAMGSTQGAGAIRRRAVGCTRLLARLLLQGSRSLVVRMHRALGRLVLIDRHTSESSLGADDGALAFSRRLVAALCPVDLVLVLDAPGRVLALRKQEQSATELEAQRLAYAKLALRLPRAVLLDARGEIDQVRHAAAGIIWRAYAQSSSWSLRW